MLLKDKAFFNKHQFDSSKYYLLNVFPKLKHKKEFRDFYFVAKNLYCLSLWRSNKIQKSKKGFGNLLEEIVSSENKKMEVGVCGNLVALYL